LPFVDAYEAGLWLFFVLEREVIAVPRPALQIAGEQLHCEDGPAVQWPGGAAYYFVRGVQVPGDIIERPDLLTADRISVERNSEIRRVMLDRFGAARWLAEIGARPVHEDSCGRLYRAELMDDEPLVMVEVVNATPEPDGSTKTYWLRVPPDIETARAAVAWTFDISPERYAPLIET